MKFDYDRWLDNQVPEEEPVEFDWDAYEEYLNRYEEDDRFEQEC